MDEGLSFDWSSFFSFDVDAFLNLAGSSPFAAMVYLMLKGGWIIFIFLFFYMLQYGWLTYQQNKTAAKKEWILLRITVPKASEQTCKAVENIFANFAGAHSPFSWTEKWIQGQTQSPISLEIASIEGRVHFYIRSERRLRDLTEAAIYAQYPDAEIDEVEDYARQVPSHYPDDEWDLWGTEMTNVKPDPYPLKTYVEFEDAISGEFKDPMAVILENFSRLGPGEQAWFQIIITPTDQKAERVRAEKIINKIKGIKEEKKMTVLDHIVDFPIKATQTLVGGLIGGGEGEKKPEKKKEEFPRMMALSPGERFVLEAIERKAGKIGFMTKIRFIYVGKKEAMKKPKVVNPFIGGIKQMNTFHMQALKPESKHVGVNSTLWWFKDRRNAIRKHHLILGYRNRSNWGGLHAYFLASDELATLWHFPILLQVKAPGTGRTESKKTEPPANIPFM